MFDCFNKYKKEKYNYLKRKILELYHFDSYDLYNDSYVIDIDEYDSNKMFIDNCISEIDYRLNIMNKFSILNFSECSTSNIQEINDLKGIIIYCGEYNYELEDIIYEYLCNKYELYEWALKYGILLIVDY